MRNPILPNCGNGSDQKVEQQKEMNPMSEAIEPRKPIRWVGVLFAVAVNMILVTLADLVIQQLTLDVIPSVVMRLVAPFIAGLLTALYVGDRGGIHALLGGLISVPFLATFVLPGAWRVSLLAGVLCAMGGAVTEFLRRR